MGQGPAHKEVFNESPARIAHFAFDLCPYSAPGTSDIENRLHDQIGHVGHRLPIKAVG